MDRARVNRVAGVARVGMAPTLGPDAAHTITTVTDDGGGNAVITTAGVCGLVGGEAIVISGVVGGSYNGTFTANNVVNSPTNSTFDIGNVYTADGAGGSWRLGP